MAVEDLGIYLCVELVERNQIFFEQNVQNNYQ